MGCSPLFFIFGSWRAINCSNFFMVNESGTAAMTSKNSEWKKWAIGLVLAALTSYFTSRIESERRVTTVETTQKLQFEEMQRRMSGIESGISRIESRIDNSFQRVLQEWANGVDKKTLEPLPYQTYIEQRNKTR